MMQDKDRQFREECARSEQQMIEYQQRNQLLFARLFQVVGAKILDFQSLAPPQAAPQVYTDGNGGLAVQQPSLSSLLMQQFNDPVPSGVVPGVNTLNSGGMATQMPNQSSIEMGLGIWFQDSGVDPSVLNYTG